MKTDLQEILDLIDISELLDDLGIDYKNKGAELFARCPSPTHRDVAASWSINVDPDSNNKSFGLHNCFSCGFKGNIVTLVAAVKNCSNSSAMEYLESFSGIEEQTSEFLANLMLTKRYVKKETKEKIVQLTLPKLSKSIIPGDRWHQYLKSRGISLRVGNIFGILAAPAGSFKFKKQNGEIYKDKHDRILFPLKSGGTLISYSGRAIEPDVPKKEKSLKSRGKGSGNYLFGYDNRKGLERAYLVEGEFDALALYTCLLFSETEQGDSFGTMTNRLNLAQAKLLRNYKEVVIIPDNDPAGKELVKSTKKFITGSKVFEVTLPSGYDPNQMYCESQGLLFSFIQMKTPVLNIRRKIFYASSRTNQHRKGETK